jgi:hypothetical protein
LEQFQARFDRLVKENNKLKLDNAALRAENTIIKRQLNYFENLFAKKTSNDSGQHSTASSFHSNDSESGNKNQLDASEVSFVLERNTTGQSTARRLGMFSLALIMCICCCSQLFDKESQTTDSRRLAEGEAPKTTVVVEAIAETVKQVVVSTPAAKAANSYLADYIPIGQNILMQLKSYFLIIMIVFTFTCAIVLFPSEQFVQWAARKPLLRKLFNLKHVPIAAQTKFLKTEEKLY